MTLFDGMYFLKSPRKSPCIAAAYSLMVLLLAAVFSHAQSESEKLNALSSQVVRYFQSGKYDLALTVAQEFRDLAITIDGPNGEMVIKAYENLGAIYRAQDDCTNAIANFTRAVELRRAGASNQTAKNESLLRAIGECQVKLKHFSKAAETYRLAIPQVGSNDEKRHFRLVLDAANAEAQAKNFVQANDLYKRAYKILSDFYEPNDPVRKEMLAFRTCYFDRFKENEALSKDYREANNRVDEANPRGVKNGKATSLEVPPYPVAARHDRLAGTVFVLIDIDEKGKVTDASVICSDPVLGGAAIAVARRARFTATTINGSPVSTFGLVTYNFVAPR